MQNRTVIISGPICGGKTSLTDELCREFPDTLWLSVSLTTRSPRPRSDGSLEEDGVDYRFTTPDVFEMGIRNGELLEYTDPSPGIYYGTPRTPVEHVLATTDKIVVFVIDYVGVEKLLEIYPGSRVFWVTARHEILTDRLKQRPNMPHKEIDRRLTIIQKELSWHNLIKKRSPNILFDIWNDVALEVALAKAKEQLSLSLPELIKVKGA